MSQHDFTIDNQGFPAFRTDLNNALQALASTNTGATEPTTTFAGQLWVDTANDVIKLRNEANDGWVTLPFDSTDGSLTVSYVDPAGDTMTGDLNFGDNDKAVFGAGSDLQIYHDGGGSIIKDVGAGDLRIGASTSLFLMNGDLTENTATFNADGACTFYYDNSAKLETTSTGVSVTGTVSTDRATGTVTTDNDLSFDMSASNNFACTPSGTGTLTFTNITAGQSGNIYLNNSGGHAISAAATVLISAADLSKLSTAGAYFVSYYSADGTNVAVSVSSAVTSAGA